MNGFVLECGATGRKRWRTLICGSLVRQLEKEGGAEGGFALRLIPSLEIAEVTQRVARARGVRRTALDRRYCSKSRRGRGIRC